MPKSWNARCNDNPDIMFKKALSNAKKRSKEKDLKIDIDLDYIKELYKKQSGKCYYSGLPINIVKKSEKNLHDNFKMTLDRLNSDLGYIKGNVVWCAYCINSFKLNMSREDMINICNSIVNNSRWNKRNQCQNTKQ